MNRLTLLQSVIPVVVPMAIAVLKHFAPCLPKPWLPVLAPLLGAILDFLSTLQVGAGTVLGAALGSAGVGLREILDQLRRAGQDRDDGPATEPTRQTGTRQPPFAPLLFLLVAPMFLAGCKTPDEAAFKTIASLEAAVDHAMNAWADYVVWRRAAPTLDEALAEQERQVKTAYTSYRLAMSAAYAARAAYVTDKQAGFPTWQARLEAARVAAAELMKLVDAFLKSAPLTHSPALTTAHEPAVCSPAFRPLWCARSCLTHLPDGLKPALRTASQPGSWTQGAKNLPRGSNPNPTLTPLSPTRALGTLQATD